MTFEEQLQQLALGELKLSLACKYLMVYAANLDWEAAIKEAWPYLERRSSREDATQVLWRTVSFVCLLKEADSSTSIDYENPVRLLLGMQRWPQYDSQDWFAKLQEKGARDLKIRGWRQEVWKLGHVEHIELQPEYRQAFNWMYARATAHGDVTDSTERGVQKALMSLTQIYGGRVICNIFERHTEKLKKVLNWRTEYFMERAIFDTYKIDKVLKIKQLEFEQTNDGIIYGRN